MLCHGSQAVIVDSLAIDAGHMGDFVAHDEVGGGLVLGFVAIAGLYLGLADWVAKEFVEIIL